MNELPANIVEYDAEDQIFVLSLSGNTDEHKLEESVRLPRSSLDLHLDKDSPIKSLIDFRETIWDSEKTHLTTRKVLGEHLQKFRGRRYFFALLTHEHAWQTSDHEAHFNEEQEAWTWLRSKQ